jgi:hypothetical protein
MDVPQKVTKLHEVRKARGAEINSLRCGILGRNSVEMTGGNRTGELADPKENPTAPIGLAGTV